MRSSGVGHRGLVPVQRAAGGGEHDRHPEAPGDVHHVQRAPHVDLAVAARVLDGGHHARLRGEVEDRAGGRPLDRRVQRRAVGDVERVQPRRLRHVARVPRGEVVDHVHLVALREQGVHEVRADEAGSAGDEGAVGHPRRIYLT